MFRGNACFREKSLITPCISLRKPEELLVWYGGGLFSPWHEHAIIQSHNKHEKSCKAAGVSPKTPL